MKTDEVLERGPRLSEKDIADFEEGIKSSLPADYRAFLLATNGGEPPEGAGWFRMKTRTSRKWSHLRFFYGLRRPDVTGWLLPQALRDFRDSVDPNTIPTLLTSTVIKSSSQ
jgi:hypothetical protein